MSKALKMQCKIRLGALIENQLAAALVDTSSQPLPPKAAGASAPAPLRALARGRTENSRGGAPAAREGMPLPPTPYGFLGRLGRASGLGVKGCGNV
ncbi:MAG: hypothetical protein ACJA1L_000025 [Paracoccaceae bacterium]|jgi:hypothetical protein